MAASRKVLSIIVLVVFASVLINANSTGAPANNTTPAVNGTTPAVNGTTPAVNGTTPAGNGTTVPPAPGRKFAVTYSKPGADCLIKIWDGRNRPQLEESITRFYSQVKILKPPSSRSHSAELFLLGRGFKGLKSSSSQKSVPTDVPPVDPS
ncbi:hypothetical protein M8J76_016581 [Diaphorina citri]|nr:hypothetical protein M8J76_016581 [Diaphorina citri]